MDLLKYAGLCLALIGAGCASRPEPAAISKAAGPEAAITAQEEVLEEAQRNHVDVLSPVVFKESNKFLEKAKNQKDDKDIYESLGISKAYLLEAQAETNARSLELREIVDARNEAITAGADFAALESADDDLIKFTKDSDDYQDMKSADKNKITAKYHNAELAAIKTSKLAEIKTTLEVAKSKGAQTLVPKTYQAAQLRYRAAEKAIETDRHSQNHYRPAVAAAAASANRTLSLVETAVVTQNQTPEQRALSLDARNKAVTDAAAKFDSSEAEVYRQGPNLVIRLKQVNFASGRSELPAKSMLVLGKVKSVLQELHPKNVTIQGHTDAVGTATKNQTLSEKRAAAVAKYFESDSALSGNHFDTAGFGFSKPLTSNKTREGRAQNRRVDIIITPGQQL